MKREEIIEKFVSGMPIAQIASKMLPSGYGHDQYEAFYNRVEQVIRDHIVFLVNK